MQLNAFAAPLPFQAVGTLLCVCKCLDACGRFISLRVDDKDYTVSGRNGVMHFKTMEPSFVLLS